MEPVCVAIVDSGVRDLPVIASQDFVTPLGAPEWPADPVDHGTRCARIVLERAPDAELLSARVLDARLRGTGGALIDGLRWSLAHGAALCNLSLSTSNPAHRVALGRLAASASAVGGLLVTAVHTRPNVMVGLPAVIVVGTRPDLAGIERDPTGLADLLAPDPTGGGSPSLAAAAVTGRLAQRRADLGRPLSAREAVTWLSASVGA